jgi:hypothetical protein
LNTNLEETKNQTGDVGESLARLEQSHEQLEAAMRSAFGYKGWEEMSNSLKNDLYVSLTNVVSGIDKVKSAMETVYAPVMAVSDAMYGWLLNSIDKTEALKATILGLTGPLGQVLNMLDAIGSVNLSRVAQDAYDKKVKEVEGQMKGTPGTFYVSNPEPGRAGNGFAPSVTTTAARTTGRTGGGRTGRTGTGGRSGGRTGGTGSTTTSPTDRAKAKYEQAEKDYNQALEQATMELNAGTINRAEAKKKELQATESLWKAIGDAQEIHNSPELKKAKEETEKKYTELSASLTAEVEAQKAADKAAKELEAAEKTLAKAQEALAEAKQTGDLGQVISAEKKVSAAQTAVTNIKSPASSAMEVPIIFNEKNLNTAIEALRSKIQEAPLNSDLLSRLTESLEDAENISAIISTAMNNGISLADFDGASIINKILNAEDIDDATIENYVAQVNEKLKEKLGESEDIPEILITFDADTSKVVSASKKQREEAQKTAAGWNLATQSVNNLGTALSNLEDPGVKALGTVLKAIADIALGFAQAATAPDVTSSGWGWLVWLAAGTAAMATTIATVHSLTGFANGGIVPGNNMSGDNLHTSDYGINSGELILNRSQQNAIASQLSGGSLSNLHLESHVSGDDLVFVLNTNDSIWGRDNYIMNR